MRSIELARPIRCRTRGQEVAIVTHRLEGADPFLVAGRIVDSPDRAPDCWRPNGYWHESDRQTRYDLVQVDRGDGHFVAFRCFEDSTATQTSPHHE